MKLNKEEALREVTWTALYAYLSCWVGGLLYFLPSFYDAKLFTFPVLFFLYLQMWGELGAPCTSNPAYWMKNYVFDEITLKHPRKTPPKLGILFRCMLLDVLGFVFGITAYVLTLYAMKQTPAAELKLHSADYSFGYNWLFACWVEFLVTLGTQLAGPALEYTFGIDQQSRPGVMFANIIGILVFLDYGLEITGGYMNPASATGLSITTMLFRGNVLRFSQLCTLLVVYVLPPLVAGVAAGVIEAGIEISMNPLDI